MAVAHETASLAGLRILVVEDMFQIAELIDSILQGFGCEVVGPVPRLPGALSLARDEQLDGAILDVNLDGKDVGPVAQLLEARGVPFVFVTGYGRQGDLPARFQDAPRLTKPFTAEQLRRLLARRFLATS